MSTPALYDLPKLPFWNETQINLRHTAIKELSNTVKNSLTMINPGWKFARCEGPPIVIKPRHVSESYDSEDIWLLDVKIDDQIACLRPETTHSSYEYARYLIKTVKGFRPPLCVWQSGMSFRREQNEGARAANLRYWGFHQLEFQCIYSMDTKADYRTLIQENVLQSIAWLTKSEGRIVPSDRLPEYSLETNDIEVMYNGAWREMCSISTRKDFASDMYVLEVAVGLDRIVIVNGNS